MFSKVSVILFLGGGPDVAVSHHALVPTNPSLPAPPSVLLSKWEVRILLESCLVQKIIN